MTTPPARPPVAAPEGRRPEHPAGPSNGSAALLTAEDVAAKLGVTKRWVYAETRADRIPHVRLGPRYVRYREQAIDAWLAGLERGAPGIGPGGSSHGQRDRGAVVTSGVTMALSDDPAKRARQLANLRRGGSANAGSFKAGQPSPNLRHGLRTRPPSASSAWRLQILKPAFEEILDALAEAAPLRDAAGDVPVHDRLALEAVAVDLVIVRRCLAYLANHGFEDSRGNLRPEVDGLGRANDRLMAKLGRMGMTPAGRARLGLDLARTADLATAMSEPDPDRRAELMAAAGVPIDGHAEEVGGDG